MTLKKTKTHPFKVFLRNANCAGVSECWNGSKLREGLGKLQYVNFQYVFWRQFGNNQMIRFTDDMGISGGSHKDKFDKAYAQKDVIKYRNGSPMRWRQKP